MADPQQDQIDVWNGRVGAKWAAMSDQLDVMLAAAQALLAERVGPVAGLRLLEIGCGSGGGCRLWLEGGATVTGVDVSAPMLTVARRRLSELGPLSERVRLIEADAALWREKGGFDLALSQFGVMFFAAPVAAFRNIAANLRPGGRLVFICWRSVAENPWVTVPMAAVADLVDAAVTAEPSAPGPFALAQADQVENILSAAGFSQISLTAADFPVYLAERGGAVAAAEFLLRIGPTSAALAEAGPELRETARSRLCAALQPYQRDGGVALGGAAWLVEALVPPY